ncbi:TPA: hypothetical protein HA231_02390 [Candidatus Woesearchaeota archaeon]|nr:hypothetical protein [Candidatus Woesearchaeota archaeon]
MLNFLCHLLYYAGDYDCKPTSGPQFDNMYAGALIDTHYNIPHFDNPPPWERNNIAPLLGDNIRISDIACTLQQENTTKAFAFFPVFPGRAEEYLQIAKRSRQMKNPNRSRVAGYCL